MYRKNRCAVTEKFKKVIAEHNIRTQSDFIKKYKETYKQKLSQPYVSRMFRNANIKVDLQSGYYKYMGAKPIEDDSLKKLDDLTQTLSLHSIGQYTHEKGARSIWLRVEPHSEKMIAQKIIDYVGQENITILYGIGTLWVKAVNKDIYDILLPILKDYIIE